MLVLWPKITLFVSTYRIIIQVCLRHNTIQSVASVPLSLRSGIWYINQLQVICDRYNPRFTNKSFGGQCDTHNSLPKNTLHPINLSFNESPLWLVVVHNNTCTIINSCNIFDNQQYLKLIHWFICISFLSRHVRYGTICHPPQSSCVIQ